MFMLNYLRKKIDLPGLKPLIFFQRGVGFRVEGGGTMSFRFRIAAWVVLSCTLLIAVMMITGYGRLRRSPARVASIPAPNPGMDHS